MSTIITGLFASQNQAQKLNTALQEIGIHNDEYIIYLHDYPIDRQVKTSIWRSFFRDRTELQDDSLVVTVKVRDEQQKALISKVFAEHGCLQENCITNVRFRDAKSLQYLRKIVALRARAEVFEPRNVSRRPS